MGKKVKFTPINIIINWAFNQLTFIVTPVINGNQFTNPPSKAKTAPILKT
jgi:hypothetical protein